MKCRDFQPRSVRFCSWGTIVGWASLALVRNAALGMGACFALGGCHSENSTVGQDSTGATHLHDGAHVMVPEKSELLHYLVLGAAAKETMQEPLLAPAVLEADSTKVGNILPPLSGRISTLYVHMGDSVKAGQPLFSIDSSDLAQARADLQHARVAVFSTLGIPLMSTESPRELTVRSPVTGRISTLNAVAGTFANDNTAALMTVSDVSTIWFTASVQEKNLAFVRAGEEVSATVQSFPGETSF
jgi:cobalt-zinc-cadmium efflux system membrane fusion protein